MSDSSRTRVLVAIEAASSPQTIEQVAESTGLHPNTVRSHLEVLVASGAVQREPLASSGRGRPKHAYRPMGGPSPHQTLAKALTAQFAGVADAAMIAQTAEHWSEFIGEPATATSPAEAVVVVVDELNQLGFAAEEGLIGDIIVLRNCPYADLVEDHPVVCDVHAALLTRLLEGTGQDVSMRSLDVAPVPHTCVVRLNRPDLAPHRVIEPAPKKKAAR